MSSGQYLYKPANVFRTIFDVDIENFEDKPWKYPNVDTSDFFNFGLNEESWKDYCKQLVKLQTYFQRSPQIMVE